MAKPREKVRNALLHNYDTATNLASKVIDEVDETTGLLRFGA